MVEVASTLDQSMAMALDPSMMFRVVTGFSPDPWQASLLRSEAKRTLVLASRQVGKSLTASVMATYTAVFVPESLTLLVSPSLRQSGEIFRKVLDGCRRLSDFCPIRAESALRVELANGSRVVSLPGSEATTRGYSGTSLLVLDEAARISDELLVAVRPTLAVSAGRLLALSTAWLRTGWFFEAWTGAEQWERVRVPAADCPRISAAFLREEKAALGQLAFEAEYGTSFVDESGSYFDSASVRAALDPSLEPLHL